MWECSSWPNGSKVSKHVLILLLLHGANAALNAPAGTKWQTLSACLRSFCTVICNSQAMEWASGKQGCYLTTLRQSSKPSPKMQRTYKVRGEDVLGWFTLDFTADQLIQNVTLILSIFSRPSTFDGSLGMYMLDDVAELHPPHIWLNVQYNSFFLEHKQELAFLISPQRILNSWKALVGSSSKARRSSYFGFSMKMLWSLQPSKHMGNFWKT